MMNDGGEGEQMLIPEKKQNLPSRLTAKERSWRPTWVHIAKPYFKKKKVSSFSTRIIIRFTISKNFQKLMNF